MTGAKGFVGKALTARLEALGYAVLPFSKSLGHDLLTPSPFDDFLRYDVQTVFHLAGNSYGPESWDNPSFFYDLNTLGTQKVLNFCRKKGCRLIYVSTYVYGLPRYLPVDEKHPVAPHTPYAHSKWLGEEICRFYSQQFHVKTAIVRAFNIYGPGQSDRFLVPHIVKQGLVSGRVEVDDLKPKRDFLFIDDFIDACVAIYNQPFLFEIYNAGFGASLSVDDVITTLEVMTGKRIARLNRDRTRRNEIPDVVAKCRLVTEGLWKPKTSFRDGLLHVLRSFG